MTIEELLQIMLANAPSPLGPGGQLPPVTDQGIWADPNALRKQFPTAIGPGEVMIGSDTAERVLRGMGEGAIDVTPGLGDVKAVSEAVVDPTLVNIGAAALGAVPVVGDVAGKTLKKVWTAADLKGVPKEIADRVLGKPKHSTVYQGTQATFAPEPGYPLGRFKDEFIGSGEGSQYIAYGHYGGQAKGTGEYYRDLLRSKERILVDGEPYYYKIHHDGAKGLLVDAAGDVDEAIEAARNLYKNKETYSGRRYIEEAIEELETLRGRVAPVPKGNIYESAMYAADEKMLQWDRAFSQNPQKLQDAVTEVIEEDIKRWGTMKKIEDVGYMTDAGEFKGLMRWEGELPEEVKELKQAAEDAYAYEVHFQATKGFDPAIKADRERLEDAYDVALEKLRSSGGKWIVNPDATGQDVWKSLVTLGNMNPPWATKRLLEKDVHGVKFLDQFSRTETAEGSRTYNYVTFNPDDLEILRILGLSGVAIGAGGMTAAMAGSEGGSLDELTQQMTQ